MSPDIIDERVQTVIDQLDINDFADRHTKGFSQGQRTKVSLARSLVHEPQKHHPRRAEQRPRRHGHAVIYVS